MARGKVSEGDSGGITPDWHHIFARLSLIDAQLDWWDTPRDRVMAVYREAYQQEERETYRARTVMADIKDELLRDLTLPRFNMRSPVRKLANGKARTPVPYWLAKAVAQDLVALMELGGVLIGDVFAAWPAGPDGQPLSFLWEEIADLALK